MKVLFMGTPDLAKTVLEKLITSDNEVVCVVSQPDKPKGRGYEMTPSPVKMCAIEHSIDVFTPDTLKNEELVPILEKYMPDVIVVAAYGKILPEYIIKYGKYGCLNVHGSLLPKYRGAAPIHRAIIDGETETGITIMKMDCGLDTGDMLLKRAVAITPEDDFETLHDKLSEIGGELICEALDKLSAGELIAEKQNDSLSNYAKKITKDDCLINFSDSAADISNRIRGLSPIPLAFGYLNGKMVKIIKAAAENSESINKKPGTVLNLDDGVISVACGNGILKIKRVLPEGKSRMSAGDFINGRRVNIGDIFTSAKGE